MLLRAIEHALVAAWNRILSTGGPDLLEAFVGVHEDAITDPLVTELERMRVRGELGPMGGFFAAFIKSEELWDHAHRSQALPDIVVRLVPPPELLVYDPRYYGVFIESKVIDSSHKKSAKLYCTEGVISRFVSGLYAWKMRQAIMCAYVLDGSSLMTALGSEFSTQSSLQTREPLTPRAWPVPSRAEIADSTHARTWSYSHPNVGSPGSIALSHVWLRLM
nr:hypothetical protein [Deltaproteobacteria bacterium]